MANTPTAQYEVFFSFMYNGKQWNFDKKFWSAKIDKTVEEYLIEKELKSLPVKKEEVRYKIKTIS